MTQIRLLGDPVLEQLAESLTEPDEGLYEDLFATLRKAGGSGIAAPQIGASKAVCVVRMDKDQALLMVNPRIVWASDLKEVRMLEGCLSIPGFSTHVWRSGEITVVFSGRDLKKDFELKLKGLAARIVQHEVDHLHGIIITNYCSRQLRKTALRMCEKAARRR